MNNAAMKWSSSVAKIHTKVCMDNHGFKGQNFFHSCYLIKNRAKSGVLDIQKYSWSTLFPLKKQARNTCFIAQIKHHSPKRHKKIILKCGNQQSLLNMA